MLYQLSYSRKYGPCTKFALFSAPVAQGPFFLSVKVFGEHAYHVLTLYLFLVDNLSNLA